VGALDLENIYKVCDFCGKEVCLAKCFRCAYCHRVCCDVHVDDDYVVCPECDGKDVDELYELYK